MLKNVSESLPPQSKPIISVKQGSGIYQVFVCLSAAVERALLNGLPPHRLLVEGDLHMVHSLDACRS